jgi:hypothetical protein
MILLCGHLAEPPLELVHARLVQQRAPVLALEQRQLDEASIDVRSDRGSVTGDLRVGDSAWALEDVSSVYVRLQPRRGGTGYPTLTGRAGRDGGSQRFYQLFLTWLQIAPGRVVTRPEASGSNSSKAYQLQLIREHGFHVPETLVTNDPDLVLRFRRRHRSVVVKSVSSRRSIVRTLREEDLRRLDRVLWCPTQFQELVSGVDVRVHTLLGNCFATVIHSDAVDYRYAERHGGAPARMSAVDLPGSLRDRCLALAASLGLPFAGIDLKLAPDGRIVCLEVNPSPAYSFYELRTGQPISRALAEYLSGSVDGDR